MAHNSPEKLFKFCSFETGAKILSSQTLRWSSPGLFNDAFELNHATPLGFDEEMLIKSAIKLSSAMIFAREQPKGDTPLINAIKRWREEERFGSPEEADGVLRELLSKMVDHRMTIIAQLKEEWVKYTQKVRICCFTSRIENLTAWQRFSDQHQGIALRFEVGENTLVKKPVSIDYSVSRPEITPLKDQIHGILYNTPDHSASEFQNKLSVKAPISKVEQEWRCFSESPNARPSSSDPNEWYDDLKFDPSELQAVYFGANISEANKNELLKIIAEEYKSTRKYQARLSKCKFELEWEKL